MSAGGVTQQLGPGGTIPRKRAMFGLLDADGWAWAGVKAGVWLVIIILMLGYIPDRAYYLTVNRTVDLGVLVWSPINLCSPENEDLPCPAPVGAVVPWQLSPEQLALPAPRTDGGIAQVGTKLLYIGGSDGTTAQSTVYVAETVAGRQLRRVGGGHAAARAALRRDDRDGLRRHLRHRRPGRERRPDDDRLLARPEHRDGRHRRVAADGRPDPRAGPRRCRRGDHPERDPAHRR